MPIPAKQDAMKLLDILGPGVVDLPHREEGRQFETLNLIAFENVASFSASCPEGPVFTSRNIEGYPSRCFAGGCQFSDQVEILAIEHVEKVFGAEHTSIQSNNATIANIAVLTDLLNPGNILLGLTPDNGGYLSHGVKFRCSGRNFNALYYGVDEETGMIDMDQVRQMASENKPKLIVTGASFYLRVIDYKAFREICDEAGVYSWVDCAYDCDLTAGGTTPSPVPCVDVATTSTQKALHGPRGCGMILRREELAVKLDRGVFPRLQGGPRGDTLTARGILFLELLQSELKTYVHQACVNAKALAQGCQEEGMCIITGGTDTHMVMLDVTPAVANGQEAEDLLSSVGIVVNRNMTPYDTLPPGLGSGLRIGSSTMTTRGAKKEEVEHIGHLLGYILNNRNNSVVLAEIKEEVYKIAISRPMFSSEQVPPSIREKSEAMYYSR